MSVPPRSGRRSLLATVVAAALAAAGTLAPLPAAAAEGSRVLINEVYFKGGSANAAYSSKFIELYNDSDVAQSLDGWSVQYSPATRTAGAQPSASNTVALSGEIAARDYYLIGLPGNGGANAVGAALPTPDITGSMNPGGENGVVWLASTTERLGLPTGDIAGVADVVDLLGTGTANTFEGAAAPVTGGNSVPNSLARTGFVDTGDNAADFSHPATITPQASASVTPDPEPTPDPTGDPEPTQPGEPTPTGEPTEPGTPALTPIREIQGTGAASPLVGSTVTTRGVVTAAYTTGGYNGFAIQTPGTGGPLDLATHTASEGIYVFSSAAAAKVAIGDHVEVTGPVVEFNGLTEISPTSADAVTVLDEPAEPVTPAEVVWPGTDAERETLESMLLAPQGAYTVSDVYSTNFYGSIGLAAGTQPLLTPTEVAAPGSPEYDAAVADNAARKVTLDDGASINFNSNANKSVPLTYLSTTDPVRVGAAVTFTAPVVLDFRNDLWNFQPTRHLTAENAADVQPVTFENTRTAAPAEVGGDIRIAGFNVLNYFTTTGADAIAAGASCTFYNDRAGNPVTVNTCSNGPAPRGAADDANLERQQAKIVAAINGLDADVVSLEEIENSLISGTDRDVAVSTLVDALNAALGDDVWAFAPSPASVPAGEDVIRTAFIYKKDAVELVGDSVIDGDAAFSNARYPLAQAFAPVGGGEDDVFVAIVNHFKSKGSGSGADADQGDGQGASNASRVAQAEALVDFAEELKVDVDTDYVFLVGDFNSYTQEDPMQVFYEAGYVNQGAEKTDKYTYSFSGQSGSLDHILASPAADELVTGVDIWNINAAESIALEYSRFNYNVTNLYDASPYRSSDHDPVVVGLAFPEDEESGTVDLNLLNINDFHGRIDANTVKFAATVEQLRAEHGDENTLFLSAGDNIGASLFASAVAEDVPTLDVLNALEMAASAVGNHEFDQGVDDLTGRVAYAADFPYLGANVYAKGTQEPVLDEYALFEVDGLTVAVIGTVTEETSTLVTPDAVATIDFGDPVDAVNRVAAELEGVADVIIAEYHEGAGDGVVEGSTLAEEVAAGGVFAKIVTETSHAVDVIFTGHTHKQYVWDGPVPGTDTTRPIVQTGNYGERIGQVVLELDATDGAVISYEARNVSRIGGENTPTDAQLAEQYPRVAEVSAIVADALAEAAVIGNEPIGSVTADITSAFSGGSYVDGVYAGGTRDDRASESTLGNLVAESLVSSLSAPERGGAEIGVVNPGGLRAELFYAPDGVVTYAEANAVLPFVNNLWTTTLTGEQFIQVLEQQWQPDGSSRSYLQLGLSSNVAYTFDAGAARGERITGVWIDGEPIDPAGEYRIGSFNFLLQGGDNFTTFREGADTRDSGLVDRDAWIDYIRSNSPLSPDHSSRGVQVTGVPASAERLTDVSFQVSGLDLTSLGSPANTTLVPSVEGSAATFAPVAVTNGAATVTMTIPVDAPAATTVVLTAPDSGTEVRLSLAVRDILEPVDPEEPGEGTEPPATTPAAPGVEELTPALQGPSAGITGDVVPGGTITVLVGEQYAGQWVTAWLYSTPQQLGGWHLVQADGTISVTLPNDVSGEHRLVILDVEGDVLVWYDLDIPAAGGQPATGGQTGGLAVTGSEPGDLTGLWLAVMLMIGAGAALRIGSIRRQRA